MSARPTPRKSALAGQSPITPAPEPKETVVPSDTQQDAGQPARGTLSDQTASKKRKVSFYQHPEDSARMRAALLHTQGVEGIRTLSEFINETMMAEVARLENAYNGGESFGSVAAGEYPQGRPAGR